MSSLICEAQVRKLYVMRTRGKPIERFQTHVHKRHASHMQLPLSKCVKLSTASVFTPICVHAEQKQVSKQMLPVLADLHLKNMYRATKRNKKGRTEPAL